MKTFRTSLVNKLRQDHRQFHKLQDFIDYNSLSRDDRLFFAHSGFDRFIAIAAKILENRIGPIELYDLGKPYFGSKDLGTLNGLIGELLSMIGENSNVHLGTRPEGQDRYFRRPSERETFPTHLYISRWEVTKRELLRKNDRNREIIRKNSHLPGSAYSKLLFKGISVANRVRFGPSKLTETETRAVGVLYMINLVWRTAQEFAEAPHFESGKHPNLAHVFQSGFELFSLLDESHRLVAHSAASSSRSKAEHDLIRKIFEAAPNEKPAKLIARARAQLKKDKLRVLSRKTIERLLRKMRK